MPSTYDILILSESGLAHFWKFDEASSATTAIDSAGTQNSTNSGVTTGATGFLSDASNCYNFATALCYSNPGSPMAYGGVFLHSLELWCTFVAGATTPYLFSSANSGDSSGTVIHLDSSNHLHYLGIDTGFIPATLTVYHLVWTSDGKFYVNGSLFFNNGANWFFAVAGLTQCYIGRPVNLSSGDSWKGKIEKVAWYTVALTATQVLNHYTTGVTTIGAYTFTGPTFYIAGTTGTYTLTGVTGDTSLITPSDSSGGGVFVPTSIALNGSTPVHFTYNNTTAGVYTLSVSRTLGSSPGGIVVTLPPAHIDTGDGTYCGGSVLFNVSGVWMRPASVDSPAIPHKQEWLTLFWLKCNGSGYVNNLGDYALHGTTEYCSDCDILIMTTQTDCSGNYSFSVNDSILSACVAYGKYIPNPNYDPSSTSHGLDTYIQYVLDPSTSYRYDRAIDTGFTTGVFGVVPTITGPSWFYTPESGSGSAPGNLYYGTDEIQGTDSSGLTNPGETACGNSDPPHDPAYGIARQSISANPAGYNLLIAAAWEWEQSFYYGYGSLARHTPLEGTFVYDIYDQNFSALTGFGTYIMRGGKYYLITSYHYTVVDACGASDTTIDGSIGPPTGLAQVLTTVDSSNMVSITRIGALPTPGWTDGYPGSNPNIYGPYDNPLGPSYRNWTYGTDLTPFLNHDVRYPTPLNIILPPSPVAQTISTDYSMGVMTVAWITEANSLKISSNRTMSSNHGHGDVGWDVPFVSTSPNVTTLGMSYINDRTLRIFATVGGTITSFTNSAFAEPTHWLAGIGSSIAQLCKGTRTRARTCAAIPKSLMTGDFVEFALDTKNDGTFITQSNMILFVPGFTIDFGRAWVEDMGSIYVCLCSKSDVSTHRVFFNRSLDGGTTWTVAYGNANTLTGQVASMAKTDSQVLVAILYTASSQTYVSARSYNGGLVWTEDTTTIDDLTGVFPPPVMVNTPAGLYACYVQNDQPKFLFSSDDGFEWV